MNVMEGLPLATWKFLIDLSISPPVTSWLLGFLPLPLGRPGLFFGAEAGLGGGELTKEGFSLEARQAWAEAS